MKCKKLISKLLIFGVCLTSIPLNSFANETNIQQNKYTQELSNIETKENLQKSVQKAMKSGEVDTWITGLANMPTTRSSLASAVVNSKIYCIGGYDGSDYLNTIEVYDPETDTWETKTSMPTKRSYLTSEVVDGKIYCIGGWNGSHYLNTVEVYDPATNKWETKASMPTRRDGFTSEVVNGKIYCIGGLNTSDYLNTVEVYDPATNKWETKASMPTRRDYLTSEVVDGKIYCIGGYNSSDYLNTVEVYDPATNKWETKASMPTRRDGLTSEVVNGKIYCIGGWNGSLCLNTVEVYVVSITPTKEEIAEEAVEKAEQSKDPADIEDARDLVNQLPDSPKKDELKDRLDALLPKTSTSNIDVYIQPQSILSLSLDTNSVVFEDFNGVEDMEIKNAINLTVESSLPYEISASLTNEIQNSDKNTSVDSSLLSIKANSDSTYKTFSDISIPIILLNNQDYSSTNTHGIDLMLNGKIIKSTDVYKTSIKFEVNQK